MHEACEETLFACELATPIGALELLATSGALVALRFPEHRPALALHRAPARRVERAGHPVLAQAARELGELFAGTRTRFTVPLEPRGTPFQRRVWRALLDIPFGETRSYGQLAAAIGRPSASRAVGAANARNPLAVFVPCHRVIGASGDLTGFAGGREAKRFLLALEREVATQRYLTTRSRPSLDTRSLDGEGAQLASLGRG